MILPLEMSPDPLGVHEVWATDFNDRTKRFALPTLPARPRSKRPR